MGPPFSPHSPQAQAIAGVFSLVLAIAAVVFLVVLAGVVYSSVRYRSRGITTTEPKQIFGSRKLEVLWTVVPLLMVTGLFIVTVRAMIFIDAPQETSRPPDLVITGHQWWWEARYPNGVVVPWDIHIPTSRRLRARIESADVIHDFWAPELARPVVPAVSTAVAVAPEAVAPRVASPALHNFGKTLIPLRRRFHTFHKTST